MASQLERVRIELNADKWDCIWLVHSLFYRAEKNKVPMQVELRSSGSLDLIVTEIERAVADTSGLITVIGLFAAYIHKRRAKDHEIRIRRVNKQAQRAVALYNFRDLEKLEIKSIIEEKQVDGSLIMIILDESGKRHSCRVSKELEADYKRL